jgi:hypothetical protein
VSPCAAVDLMWFCADSCDSSAAAATVWSLGSGVYLLLQNSTDTAAAPVSATSLVSTNSLPSDLLSGSTSVDTATLSVWQTNSSSSSSSSNSSDASSSTVVSLQQLIDRLSVELVLYDSSAISAPHDALAQVRLALVTLSFVLTYSALQFTRSVYTSLASISTIVSM